MEGETVTYKEIGDLAASVGIPSAYYQFPNNTALAPPFLCFVITGSADLYADGANYQRIDAVQFELYTDEKDFTLEAQTEAALTGAGISWAKDEGFLDSEKMHMTTYRFEVVITEVKNGE